MIIKIKAKNIRLFDEIEIDFSIKSKKKGSNVKSNDYVQTKEGIKTQKKIGIIGSNASGKTSFLNVFMIFWRYFNIGKLKEEIKRIVFNNIISSKIIENKNVIDKNNSYKAINDEFLEINDFLLKNQDYLNKELINGYLDYYSDSCYDANLDQIYFEFHHIFDSNVVIRKFYINKNGNIRFETYDNNGKLKDEKEIIFYNHDVFVNTVLSVDEWIFDWIDIPFNGKFDFGLNNPNNFLTTSYNRNIITFIFDYIRHNEKQIHFTKWIKLSDPSINNIIMDTKNKIFSIKKNNDEIINLDSLSLGTKKWLILYYFIYICFPKTKLFTKIITFDEIENSFHDKLTQTLLEIIDEEDSIQLVFSTHNPHVFSKTYRHDGIYLTNYDNKKYTVNRLNEFKLRKDKVISSMYLKEEIGRHPDTQNIFDFFNENESNE